MGSLTTSILRRSAALTCALLLAGVVSRGAPDAEERLVVRAALVDKPITPVTARFIGRALRGAQSEQAECFVLELDTPGGLVTSTHQIVKDILNSEIPVVVYVSPSGGRAASAGVFIALASHVVAMAPGTRIGAAHPVPIGGVPVTPQRQPSSFEEDSQKDDTGKTSKPLEEKQVSDASAWARSLAELRGRNAEWAAAAVSESKSLTASEAVKEGVAELIADSFDELLDKLNHREVEVGDRVVRLETKQATVKRVRMWWGELVLGVLSNPNLAFLLLILGFYGILFELYTPGWGVPGTLGVLCLLLGCFGLALLPINYAGLLLILAALVLFVAEAFVTSFGALSLGGIICLVLGGAMLVDTPFEFMQVSLGLLIPVAIATAAITVFLVINVVKGHRARVQTGMEGMIGKQAVAADAFTQERGDYRGTVQVHGEYWKAQSPEPVSAGGVVVIKNRRGLTLFVAPQEQLESAEEDRG